MSAMRLFSQISLSLCVCSVQFSAGAENNFAIGVIEMQLECESIATCAVSKTEEATFRPLFEFRDGKWNIHSIVDRSRDSDNLTQPVLWQVFFDNKFERDVTTVGPIANNWVGAGGIQKMSGKPIFDWNSKRRMSGWAWYAWPRFAFAGASYPQLLRAKASASKGSAVRQAGAWWRTQSVNRNLKCAVETNAGFKTVRLHANDYIVDPYIELGRGQAIFRVSPRVGVERKCDVPDEEDALSDKWYLVDSGRVSETIHVAKEVRSNGFRVNTDFLLAGSFSGGAGQAVIFRVSGYNEDGYVLYEVDNGRLTTFTHGYH